MTDQSNLTDVEEGKDMVRPGSASASELAGELPLADAAGEAGVYRKRPVEVDAIQWTGANPSLVTGFCYPDDIRFRWSGIEIPTLEGAMLARQGDWIIRGAAGELYPCKPDIFAATYDPAPALDTGPSAIPRDAK